MSVVSKLNEIASLANELCEAWEAEGNRDASTIPSPWVFSDDRSGPLSIDEWAAQVSGLAEAYESVTRYRREWRLHWKDYTVGLDIPEDWEDVTWHNNELPSFRSNSYHVWMNAPTLEKRQEEYVINGNSLDDYEDWRFAVQLTNADGEIIYQEDGDSDLLRTTDFDEVVAFVRKPRV